MDNMDRVKRLSTELLENYPDRFTTNFEENKKTILMEWLIFKSHAI